MADLRHELCPAKRCDAQTVEVPVAHTGRTVRLDATPDPSRGAWWIRADDTGAVVAQHLSADAARALRASGARMYRDHIPRCAKP